MTRAKETVSVPVIASLNGTTSGGWVKYAARLVDAGADAIELNVYDVITDPRVTGLEVEDRVLDLVGSVRAEVPVPVAVKIGPWFSALANMATKLADAGADGLVLFNRLYQPDIDLEVPSVRPRLMLSVPGNVRQSVAWIGILSGQVPLSLAASGGVDSAEDVVKLILAGADATMTTAALLRHGPGHVETLVTGPGALARRARVQLRGTGQGIGLVQQGRRARGLPARQLLPDAALVGPRSLTPRWLQ